MRKIYAASLESCLLWQLKLTGVLSQIVIFLTVFFHWMYKMKYSCYQESSLIHGWFVFWVFGSELRRLKKAMIRFRMASFLFFTLLDAYENYKGSSDPCLTWWLSGSELHLEIWYAWVIIVFISYFMQSSAVYEASLCTFVLRFDWDTDLT